MRVADTTIVTAFYPLTKSKHGVERYKVWIQNFCKIPNAMVIFTTEAYALEMYQWRKEFLDKTLIIVRPFDSFAMTCPSMMNFWFKQWAMDPEKAIHSPELYAVWALKQEFVRAAINRNPFKSTWFVWCDMGIQRFAVLDPFYETFPSEVPRLCLPGRMTFLEVSRIPDSYVNDWIEKKEMAWPTPNVTLGGGCIAGDEDAWLDFGEAYKETLKEFAIRGWFAGKDQTVFFTMLMERRVKNPYRLFHAAQFGSVEFNRANPGLEWMCFPVMLGGAMDAALDTRFEPMEGKDY